MYLWNPDLQFSSPKASNINLRNQQDAVVEKLAETSRSLHENVLQAQQQQIMYAGKMENAFKIGDQGCLLTRNFWTTMLCMKFNYQYTGPYTVRNIIIRNDYKLDLPKTMRNHQMMDLSQLKHYTPPFRSQSSDEWPALINDLKEWEVDLNPHLKGRYCKLHYLVEWAGYSNVHMSWEPMESQGNPQQLANEFHSNHPGKQEQRRKGLDFKLVYCCIFFDWLRFNINGHCMCLITFGLQSRGGGVSLHAVPTRRWWDLGLIS